MASQYALRFETGERRGELVPIVGASMPGRAFTIGRKPGNSLQVTDASVSGRHAEVTVDEDAARVSLRDLGSTNGTHVGGARIEEADLGHGDVFLLGKVRFTVVDQGVEGAEGGDGGLELELDGDGGDFAEVEPVSGVGASGAAASGRGARAADPDGGSIEISAADLARSRRSSRLAPIVLVGVAAAAVAAFVLTRGGDGDGGEGDERARVSERVEAPAGYALAGAYSFESSDLSGWTEGDGAPTTFEWTSAAAHTGRRGLRAELRPGQRARLTSSAARVPEGGLVRIAAAVRVDGDAAARLGLDYGGGFVPLETAQGGGSDGFTLLEASGAAPEGASSARVVVEVAAGGEAPDGDADPAAVGTVDIDDVTLTTDAGAGQRAHSTGAWTVSAQSGGDGAARAVAIDWRGGTYAPLLAIETATGAPAPLEVRSDGDELLITTGAAGDLRFIVSGERVAGTMATLGDRAAGDHPGYAQHSAPFDSPAGSTSLIVGADASQMRVRFDGGRTVSGRSAGDEDGADVIALTAPVERGETIALQFDFSDERALAERLARRARQEASRDRPGVAFATWSELLEQVPYSAELVAAAGASQSRITAEGRQALAVLRDEVDRARFFRLGDLFREKLARAEELQQRYAGSEVAALAAELGAEVKAELALLERDSVRDESARLSAIRAALERAGATSLAEEVERYRGDVVPDAGSPGSTDAPGAGSNDGSAGADANAPDGGGL